MFELKPSKLSGCLELQSKVFDDDRGRFVKVFHEQAFAAQGLETAFAEEYYSVSNKNLVRGPYFQLPPMDHVKVVYCVEGDVLDAVVDLRVGSPTYRQHVLFELSAAKANSIYIPKGMAHGFCALSERATMVYKVSTIYSPAHDADVATIYGFETRDINKVVANNPEKFPAGYIVAFSKAEKNELVEIFHQFSKLKHATVAPKAFSEKGLYMIATTLKSPQATRATISIKKYQRAIHHS